MTLQEKLSAQSGNEHRIHLFKEGKFWKAYESSAFLFTKFVKKYKVQKKMVKCMAMPVASLGFPEEVFKSVVKDVEVMEVDERYGFCLQKDFFFRLWNSIYGRMNNRLCRRQIQLLKQSQWLYLLRQRVSEMMLKKKY